MSFVALFFILAGCSMSEKLNPKPDPTSFPSEYYAYPEKEIIYEPVAAELELIEMLDNFGRFV